MAYLSKDEVLRALTPRERDVVERIARGLELKEIARDLGIGYHTVKMHVARAKSKLCARNLVEIAILMHGGQPQTMPALHEHPLRLCRPIEAEPIWQRHLWGRVQRA